MLNSMSKRTDNLETLHIALELLRRIPRGSKISAPELRQQLEQAGLVRDLRTIQRQLELLSQHFGIERDEGVGAENALGRIFADEAGGRAGACDVARDAQPSASQFDKVHERLLLPGAQQDRTTHRCPA